MSQYRWLIYALISAGSASLVAIFGKLGLAGIDSTIATTLRSIVMSIFLFLILLFSGLGLKSMAIKGWPLIWIILSGVAGAVSWLFYFKALKIGGVSRVAPIDKLSMPIAVLLAVLILNEKYSKLNWLGIILIVAGAFLASIA